MTKKLTLMDLRPNIYELIKREYIGKNLGLIDDLGISIGDIHKEVDKNIDKLNQEYATDYLIMIPEVKALYESRVRTNKRRWAREEIGSKNSELQKRIELIEFHSQYDREEFMKKYQVESIEEFREREIRRIISWKEDPKSLLIEFPYLIHRGIRSKKAAIKNDSLRIIVDFIEMVMEEDVNDENKDEISQRYMANMSTPITAGRFKELAQLGYDDELMDYIDKSYDYGDRYEVENYGRFYNTMNSLGIDGNIRKSKNFNRFLSTIHDKDIEVLESIISYKPRDLYRNNRYVTVPVRDIVEDVFGTVGGKNFEFVELSMHKLSLMRFHIHNAQDDSRMTFGLLDSVQTYRDQASNQLIANVKVSDYLYNDIIEDRTIKMFKEPMKRLSSSFAKNLTFRLQADRINHIMGEESQDTRKLDLNFFRTIIYMPEKNYYRNIKKVETALEELREASLIVKDFKREDDVFEIDYLDFTDKEIDELIVNPKKLKNDLKDVLTFNNHKNQ